jgi:hypothetical protein
MLKQIIIKTQFEGFHQWLKAPSDYTYLRNAHRHMFYIEARKTVTDSDREIEFIDLKRKVTNYCRVTYEGKIFGFSCEHIAEHLLKQFDFDSVQVMEDNENGAIVYKGC